MDPDRQASAEGGGETPPPPGEPLPDGRDHRLRFQELFEFAPDGQLVSDESGVILEANHAASSLLHTAKEFLIGKPLGLYVKRGLRKDFYTALHQLSLGADSAEFASRVGLKGDARDVVIRVQSGGRADGLPRTLRWQLRDVTELNRAERARNDLTRRLAAAEEGERRRIARELHDHMGQELTGLMLGLKALERQVPEPARTKLRELHAAADRLGQAVHEMAVELRPTSLDDLGLAAALTSLVARWSARTRIPIDCLIEPLRAGRLPAEVETAVYRIAQESLTNIARHAAAAQASLIVERRDGFLLLIVEDDGRGFDPAAPPAEGRLGLLGMKERVQLLGGTLQIESSAGVGTTVRARIPAEQPSRGDEDE